MSGLELKEAAYIVYRIIKSRISSMLFFACRVFPIDDKLVSVCTFEGKGGFCCNAKPLVQELHKRNSNYKFVWFVNKQSFEKEFPEYIKKIPNTLLNRAFYLSRSGIWIDNYRKPLGTVKRKNQYYINVNHYTIGIKRTGLLRGKEFSKIAYLVSKNDSNMIDDLVIDSKWCEQCWDKALVYKGRLLKAGAPRCDILYGSRKENKEKYRRKRNLPLDAKIVMYAPTFREGVRSGKRYVFSEEWTIDFSRLIHNLEKKFGGRWYVCVRVHPQLAPIFTDYTNDAVQDRIINESHADDMYELLAGMDAYISDYSSAMFEAGLAKMPVFLYADDINNYSSERGGLMWEIESNNRKIIKNNRNIVPDLDVILPFSMATNNDELEEDILLFDYAEYINKLDVFSKGVDLLFDGQATKRIVDYIEKVVKI